MTHPLQDETRPAARRALNFVDGMGPVFECQPRDLARFMLSTQRLDDFCKKAHDSACGYVDRCYHLGRLNDRLLFRIEFCQRDVGSQGHGLRCYLVWDGEPC